MNSEIKKFKFKLQWPPESPNQEAQSPRTKLFVRRWKFISLNAQFISVGVLERKPDCSFCQRKKAAGVPPTCWLFCAGQSEPYPANISRILPQFAAPFLEVGGFVADLVYLSTFNKWQRPSRRFLRGEARWPWLFTQRLSFFFCLSSTVGHFHTGS